jgi:hypothetical protein
MLARCSKFIMRWTTAVATAVSLFAGFQPAAGAVVLAPVALGTLSTPQDSPLTGSASALQGSFEQTFTFALSATLGIGGDFLWRFRPNSSISNFDATLTTVSGAFIVSDTASSSVASSFNPYPSALAAGSYKLVVSGIGAGTSGGFFSVALSPSAPIVPLALAVPEPNTWLMFGAGLLLMCTCIRHRARFAPQSGTMTRSK